MRRTAAVVRVGMASLAVLAFASPLPASRSADLRISTFVSRMATTFSDRGLFLDFFQGASLPTSESSGADA